MLENEKLIPRVRSLSVFVSSDLTTDQPNFYQELIFLVRGQRMLQAANQGLGSPSNRVK